ncbi:MAG: aminotransferase class V-fold PLP-dependent enzyme, partial [Mariprofundaceae bacterium]
MVERLGDFDATSWRPAVSARRFEPGSPNQIGIQALHASLSLFEEVGMASIETEVLKKTSALCQWIRQEERLSLTCSNEPERRSGIVSFQVRNMDAGGHAELYRRLMEAGVICALRSGSIRLSPHFYTPDAAMERFKEVLFRT